MPGRRLTEDERRVIAAGLAGGLGYAEIARRLGRSTSTVTREVARNGGARGYGAERAQRAARLRGRRTGSGGAAPAARARADAYGRNPAAVERFQDYLAELLLRGGIPRTAARAVACLHTTDAGSLSAAELVRRLGVSAASVSKAVAYLERQGLIRRERAPGRRSERYVIDDEAWFHASIASAQRNAVLAEAARQGAAALGPTTPAGARLANTGRYLHHVSHELLSRAEYYHRLFRTGRTTERES
ncbi:MarR family transcriptional regulator [Streptomonospora nanhaiensis]|uniref:Transposase n=1 Tax=Streptomonospora nanhaiensis TaxID=1323731 RepID=A0A853BX77_9ACTN|nr:helix-turn-helix domain-containing protein [Streptomonospora nanhaiensis]MBV2364559.1 helix-turn-helix domain-containing protein [Streptomonospora nanhaiensis]MBX9390188.1 helix-turn-helix domain-containing protein [Streptomonospora nanhaiensis]NYI99091.1 transposase [Streptomonospora nanhaiensis]